MLLSQLVASTVMAGELSLMAAQVSGDLVSAHEKLGHILKRKWEKIVSLNGTKGKIREIGFVEDCLFDKII